MFEENGKQFVDKFTQEDFTCNFVWNPGMVRVNYKIIDNKSMITEINDRCERVSEEKQQELIDLTANLAQNCSIAVMSGSLPQGVETNYYARLCSSIPSSVKKIVDAEGDALLDAIKSGVYMIKPNIDELERSLKQSFATRKDMINACRRLIDLGAENVLLSLGSSGAILTNGSKSYFCKSANVAVNSTVGAGDSMVASACLQIEKGASMPEILKCAVAGGTAAVASRTSQQFKEKYEEILPQLHIEVLDY
jgi:1-phosphofructokinase